MKAICVHCKWVEKDFDGDYWCLFGEEGYLNYIDGKMHYGCGGCSCSSKNDEGDCKDYTAKFPWNILRSRS